MTTLTPAGERLLHAASELFYRRGIRAVGVDLIAETAGTTKKTLYDRFGSKDALVALYLEERMHHWQDHVTAWLDTRAPATGPERVVGVLDALADWMVQQDRGCAFVNAHAEIAGSDHPATKVIHAEKAWLRGLYVQLCREAGLDDPDRVGAGVHLLHEGAIVASTTGADPDALQRARDVARELLSTAREN